MSHSRQNNKQGHGKTNCIVSTGKINKTTYI